MDDNSLEKSTAVGAPIITNNSGNIENAHDELTRLRARAAELEAQIKTKQETRTPQEISKEAASTALQEVWSRTVQPEASQVKPTQPPVTQEAATQQPHPDAITLKLSPEKHDEKMGELMGILQAHGVSAAIAAAEASRNPHIMDDFHRVLVEYIHEGFPVGRMPKKNTPLAKTLDLVLLQVSLPAPTTQKDATARDRAKEIKDFINLMEQFYRSTITLGKETSFAFEIANAVGSRSTSAYIAVPISRKEMLEKQITTVFPSARINAVPNDYNIFTENSVISAAEASLSERPIFALREEIAGDPMESILSALSKLDAHEEGAALQVIIRPTDGKLSKKFRQALQKIHTGTPINEAAKVRGFFGELSNEILKQLFGKQKTAEERQQESNPKSNQEDPRFKAIERKIANPLLEATIRVVASAKTKDRADAVLAGIESAFEQLADTAGGNRIVFKQIKPSGIKSFSHAFSYRTFNTSSTLPLTSLELAIMAHLPRPESIESAPELTQEKNAAAPAPLELPTEGTLLGINRYRGVETKAYILPEDRLRHMYIIGQTGTGKSQLLKNIVIQDIKNGAGACFIDPHGTDVMDILSAIPPERAGDVIYFDPGDTTHPLGLNMLEYDPAHPEQKTLIVDELIGIFNKLFDMKTSGGPAFEQYFRNSALLVMDDPESGNTLLDIARIFSDDDFREMKLSRCRNEQIVQFWRGIAEKATGEQGLQNFGPYITNKFDVFTTNEIMRPIISQQHSSFNIREVMDERKILLVNLAKGRIGEINANLLGLVLVGKFLLAALSRADSFGKDMPPFYLTIDEFQNVTTPSIATILSEARKYKLSLTVAHQFIAQLSDDIRDAVFGNVGSVVAFRVGVADTEILEKQFTPVFSAADLMRVDNYRAFVRLLSRGQPTKPFNIETVPFQSGSRENMEIIRKLSALTYGKPFD